MTSNQCKEDSVYDFDFVGIKNALAPDSQSGGSVRTTVSRLGSPHSHSASVAMRALCRPLSSCLSKCDDTTDTGFGRLKMCVNRNNPIEEEQCPRSVARNLEHQINTLLDDTSILRRDGKFQEALEKAKLAVRKQEVLKKHREDHSLCDVQKELTFAVWFNVALSYETNDLLEEAINAYTFLAKHRGHPLLCRVRINLGNIYYAQHEYPSAIKMYKMALDQTRNDKQTVGCIKRNIGNAFFRLGRLRDAVKNFKESMVTFPNHQTGFNLLVCHLALGDVENIEKAFTKLVKLRHDSAISSARDGEEGMYETVTIYPDAKLKHDATNRAVLAAARLVAPSMDPKELIDTLKEGHEQLAIIMEHDQAVDRLKNNDTKTAVKTLKSLETKSREMKALVATNLSLIHFLEGDVDIASSYADIALDADRYNAKALVSKGNCFFASEDYASAKDLYLEAVGVEAGCAQAIFNLGLSNVRLHEPEEAIQAFEKLHSITPNSPAVIYHIADINENRGQSQNAMKWFNVLAASHSSDSAILSRLAYLYAKSKDESQSLHYHLESFRHFPVDLDVIAWIGAWFVQREMFDRSIYFFQQAALVQPKEIKWGLMVVSAHRRTGDLPTAFNECEKLHRQFPDNVECLRSLVILCKAIQKPYHFYEEKLEMLND